MKRESCVLCACKHLAQARIQMLEYLRSPKEYEVHYDFALGHISEAEDELVKDHLSLAKDIRPYRKKLEADPRSLFPFEELILKVRHQGEEETQAIIDKLEAEFEGKSPEDLARWWKELQS